MPDELIFLIPILLTVLIGMTITFIIEIKRYSRSVNEEDDKNAESEE